MPIKIYFNDQTYKVASFPSSLDAFFAFVAFLYGEKLPQTWGIYYSDQDGDKIRVSHEQDYKQLLELESQTPDIAIELFIISTHFPAQNTEQIQQENEDYQELLNKSKDKSTEHDKKAGKAESDERKKEIHQAKKLLKKILKEKLSGTENIEAIQKLELIQAQFNPEQGEKFGAQKELLERKSRFMQKLTEENQQDSNSKDSKSSRFAKFGKLKKVMLKIQQQSPENARIIFMTIKIFIKLFKAMKKRKSAKVAQYQLQLLSFLPDENPTTFEELFASIPQNLPKDELKERLFYIAKLYYQEFCPENNNIFEELEQVRQAKKEKPSKGMLSKEQKKELKMSIPSLF